MFPERIMIFGRPGSGKTTFALALGKRLHLPVFHLDKYAWQANWVERPYSEFMQEQNKLVAHKKWIIDGNHPWSFETRYSKADIAIYFDYPRWICLWRLLKRYFFKDQTIDDRAAGCRESISRMLLKYMWHFDRYVDQYIPPLQKAFPNVKYYVVHNDREANELLEQLVGNQKWWASKKSPSQIEFNWRSQIRRCKCSRNRAFFNQFDRRRSAAGPPFFCIFWIIKTCSACNIFFGF